MGTLDRRHPASRQHQFRHRRHSRLVCVDEPQRVVEAPKTRERATPQKVAETPRTRGREAPQKVVEAPKSRGQATPQKVVEAPKSRERETPQKETRVEDQPTERKDNSDRSGKTRSAPVEKTTDGRTTKSR